MNGVYSLLMLTTQRDTRWKPKFIRNHPSLASVSGGLFHDGANHERRHKEERGSLSISASCWSIPGRTPAPYCPIKQLLTLCRTKQVIYYFNHWLQICQRCFITASRNSSIVAGVQAEFTVQPSLPLVQRGRIHTFCRQTCFI